MLTQGPIIHLTMIVFLKGTETDTAAGSKASPPDYHTTVHLDDVGLVVFPFLHHSHGLLLSSPFEHTLLKENISNVCRDGLIHSITDWTPTQSDESVVLWFLKSTEPIN